VQPPGLTSQEIAMQSAQLLMEAVLAAAEV
jgi:hypothetical protein